MSRRRLSGRPGISQHIHETVRNENAAMEANIAVSDRQSRADVTNGSSLTSNS